MKHVYLTLATCLSLAVTSCSSDEKLRSTNAGPVDGEIAGDSIANVVGDAVLVEEDIQTTDSATENIQTPEVDSVADQIAAELSEAQEAVQQATVSTHATEIDAIECTINGLVERAKLIEKDDAKAVVDFAHDMNSARSRLNKLMKSTGLTPEDKARLSSLASRLSSARR